MESKSIHPRVENGRTRHKKVDTSKPYLSGKGILGKRLSRLQERHHSRDLTVKSLDLSSSAKKIDWSRAFRIPGSMRGF